MILESPEVKELEKLARDMTAQHAFSFAECDLLLHHLATVRAIVHQSQRQILEGKLGSSYLASGLFSHGPLHGLTRRTRELPCVCRYLNSFGKYHLAGSGAKWTSFTVSVNQAAQVHIDGHNDPASSNFTCSFGQFDGGKLWVELTEECDRLGIPVLWKTKRNGLRVPGHLHDTRHRFVQFYPKNFHATDRWSGFRISLTYYTSRLIPQIDDPCRASLKQFGFPLPRRREPDDDFEAEALLSSEERHDEEGCVMLTEDICDVVQQSCEEVWSEINALLDAHGRDPHHVQVVEFGGPGDSHLCRLLHQQGGQGYAANLQSGYDLGTRGGCHRSLQQLQVLQPEVAWFRLPCGPSRRDQISRSPKEQALHRRSRKVIQNTVSLTSAQLRHGHCVWVSDKHSCAWRDVDACQFWKQLADEGRAFEWQCGDLQVRTTSQSLYLDCSRVSSSAMSNEDHLEQLYRAVCGSLMSLHGSLPGPETSFVVTSHRDALKGVGKAELESLLDTVQKLHRRFGHPPNSLLVKNLRASPKLLAVAAEFKCDTCLESQIRTSAPAASLEREDRLWCTVQIDGFDMRFGDQIFHFLLLVEEASGFCIVEETHRHSEKDMQNLTTAQVVKIIETRWCQLFGFPECIKLDPEGAFRGLNLSEYCAERGIELGVVPAEYHEAIPRPRGRLARSGEKLKHSSGRSSTLLPELLLRWWQPTTRWHAAQVLVPLNGLSAGMLRSQDTVEKGQANYVLKVRWPIPHVACMKLWNYALKQSKPSSSIAPRTFILELKIPRRGLLKDSCRET